VLGELNVTALAQATGIEISLVSAHLKTLAAAGVVWRRRSGRAIGYRIADHAYNPVTATALGALARLFAAVTERKPKGVAAADQADSTTSSDAAAFASFTAFTHPRRLQVIRYLAQQGAASLGELTSQLSMSVRACLRHLDKLERRGFLRRRVARRRTTYTLTKGKGALQRAMLAAVLDYLVRGGQ